MCRKRAFSVFLIVAIVALPSSLSSQTGGLVGKEDTDRWTRHVTYTGFNTASAVAADFTGDGKIDVMASSGPRCGFL